MIGKSRLACQAKCPIEFQPESAVEHRAEGPNDNVRLVRLTNAAMTWRSCVRPSKAKLLESTGITIVSATAKALAHGGRCVDDDDIEFSQDGPEFLSQ